MMRRLGLIALVALLTGPALGRGKSADALLVEGGKLYSVGRCEEALAPLQAALEQDPGLSQAHRLLGECLAMLDRCGEAIPHLERALEAEPRHSDNPRTMDAMVGCERTLRERERRRRVPPAAPPGGAEAVVDLEDSTDWHGEGEPRPESVPTAAGTGDISAELAEQEGMEAPEPDNLHWYGSAAIGVGLGLVLVASIIVEDYSGWKRDVENNRCVKPNGSLKEGGCPDNSWSYGLWGAGGLLVIAGGVMMLLHDWGEPADAGETAPETAGGLTGIELGAGRRGAWLGLSGRF